MGRLAPLGYPWLDHPVVSESGGWATSCERDRCKEGEEWGGGAEVDQELLVLSRRKNWCWRASYGLALVLDCSPAYEE